MSYAGRFQHLLEACSTVEQCIELANLASMAARPIITGALLKDDPRSSWLTDLTGLAYELGRRCAELERH